MTQYGEKKDAPGHNISLRILNKIVINILELCKLHTLTHTEHWSVHCILYTDKKRLRQ